jgi:lysophospholipase L1-like esterase
MIVKMTPGWRAGIAVVVLAATCVVVAAAGPAAASGCGTPGILHVMPMGDSITVGQGSSARTGGYRDWLLPRLTGTGGLTGLSYVGSQTLDAAGRQGYPHEGYSGQTISYLSTIVDDRLNRFSPDFILLDAGTNDAYGSSSDVVAARMQTLLAQIVAHPCVRVVVAKLSPMLGGGRQPAASIIQQQFNDKLGAVVSSVDPSGARIRVVDMSILGPQQMNSEGIHPNDAGYDWMSYLWYRALAHMIGSGYLPWTGSPIDPVPVGL